MLDPAEKARRRTGMAQWHAFRKNHPEAAKRLVANVPFNTMIFDTSEFRKLSALSRSGSGPIPGVLDAPENPERAQAAAASWDSIIAQVNADIERG